MKIERARKAVKISNIKIGDCFEFNGITYLKLGYDNNGFCAVFDLINNLMDIVGCTEVMPINATLVVE